MRLSCDPGPPPVARDPGEEFKLDAGGEAGDRNLEDLRPTGLRVRHVETRRDRGVARRGRRGRRAPGELGQSCTGLGALAGAGFTDGIDARRCPDRMCTSEDSCLLPCPPTFSWAASPKTRKSARGEV